MNRLSRSLTAALVLAAIPAFAVQRLEVIPQTFDFGWAPDNAKITAEFILRNTGEEMVPLKEVIPTCGCTAANFTPSDVGSKEESKVTLTFNTRGYSNMKFHKAARVMTAEQDLNPYVANLSGHVTNAEALLIPEGDGIAQFKPDSSTHKTKITLVNKTGRDITLKVLQAPAPWATAEVPAGSIKAGEKAVIEIAVDGSNKDERNTSLTLAPSDFPDENRVTLAVRTGTPPPDYKMPAAPVKPKETAAPAKKSSGKAAPKPNSVPAPKK